MLSTNTLHAYNYWGGRQRLLRRRRADGRRATCRGDGRRASGVLSTQRPVPAAADRAAAGHAAAGQPAQARLRGAALGRRPTRPGRAPTARVPYDGSAGFLNKWEHPFVALGGRPRASRSTTSPTTTSTPMPGALDPYGVVDPGRPQRILVGAAARPRSTRFVDARRAAGDLLRQHRASGRCAGRTKAARLICHKWKGFEARSGRRRRPGARHAPVVAPARSAGRKRATTGLSFLFGGYHRLGLCAARGAGRLHGLPRPALGAGGLRPLLRRRHRRRPPAARLRERRLPLRLRRRRPAGAGRRASACRTNLEIIALAPAVVRRGRRTAYRPLIPPEQLDVVAEIAYGDAAPRPAAARAARPRGDGHLQPRRGRGVQRRHDRMGPRPGRRTTPSSPASPATC